MEKGERLRVAGIIRLARAEQGLHQTDLAELIGLSVTTVSNYERGLRAISEKAARKIEKALGMTDRRLSVALGFIPEAPPVRDGRPAVVYDPPRLAPKQEQEIAAFIDWLRFRDRAKTEGE